MEELKVRGEGRAQGDPGVWLGPWGTMVPLRGMRQRRAGDRENEFSSRRCEFEACGQLEGASGQERSWSGAPQRARAGAEV